MSDLKEIMKDLCNKFALLMQELSKAENDFVKLKERIDTLRQVKISLEDQIEVIRKHAWEKKE